MTPTQRDDCEDVVLSLRNDEVHFDREDAELIVRKIERILAPSPDPIDAITPTKGETKIFDKIPGETLEQTYERLHPDDKRPKEDDDRYDAVDDDGGWVFAHNLYIMDLEAYFGRVLTWANTLHRPEVLGEGEIKTREDGLQILDLKEFADTVKLGHDNLFEQTPGQTVKVALVKVRE